MSTNTRQSAISDVQKELFDAVIVGGGINGAVAAASLAATGLKVALLDKKDYASSTSQESSNLVWGGIKYLESYEFGLVWDLCRSRNELMRRYPSAVTEIGFFTNLEKGFRKPRILVFLGALLYWFMGRFKTRAPRLLSKGRIEREEPIVDTAKSQGGLEYADCFLRDNDARFVFQFIRRAARAGARVLNYTEVQEARYQEGQGWTLNCQDHFGKTKLQVRARVLINAAGPYADALNSKAGVQTQHRHIFSKGVHLIVPKLTDSERVLTFFADDGRLFFVIPMGPCSCIGTTDTRVEKLPPQVTDEDRAFILENINKRLRLKKPIQLSDVIAERCGVRPLVIEGRGASLDGDDWMNLSRKHAMEVKKAQMQVSIFGGKLTDCLNIGREMREAMQELGVKLNPDADWFGESPERHRFMAEAKELGLSALESRGEGLLVDRLWRCYDRDAFTILQHIRRDPSLKESIAGSVILAEVLQMAENEMIVHLEDMLRRRTRLALVVPKADLESSQALRKACHLLFGVRSETEWDLYFGHPLSSQSLA